MSLVTGAHATRFGRHEGRTTLDLMSEAATAALADAGSGRKEIDGLVCGYSTTQPHLMLATVFAEHFGLKPSYAHTIQMGGATGLGMVMLAHRLVESGAARRILVVAGENRLTGQSRDSAIQTLAQVGHPVYEVPLGPTIPAYYGLVASRYLHETGATEADCAELAVLMRANAARHPGSHIREPVSVDQVLASKPIAAPLKLMDCCPVSDGGAAFVVEREDRGRDGVRIRGVAQMHPHQHVSAATSLGHFGIGDCGRRALDEAGLSLAEIDYAGIYDSFTVTLAILLEELGLAPRGQAGRLAREGHFAPDGPMPLNTHGGLLAYGHCGVAGAMAHLAETFRQMTGRAGERQIARPRAALLHADGGVLSSHVSVVLEGRA
ncbi:thiolase family protein [Enterovirga rhinocerotis]|uniref:Acetyl-CoA acetyltransferase n=1 Tax=Enterovirga rhinocerotis TaxID=1339210 RepID=A0A4R7BLL6_9HYPH|nr:thiolase family protein [Enterovirga rhinocerotis]TDR85165.1 acetyl-CoA acetyltransferase [Enterovirga rhinocerotis]